MQFTNDDGNLVVAFDRLPAYDAFVMHVWKRAGDPVSGGAYSLEPNGDGTFDWVLRAELEECPPMLRMPGWIARQLIDAIQAGDEDESRFLKIVGGALAEAVFAWSQDNGPPIVPDYRTVLQNEWIKGWEKGYESGYINGHDRGWEDAAEDLVES